MSQKFNNIQIDKNTITVIHAIIPLEYAFLEILKKGADNDVKMEFQGMYLGDNFLIKLPAYLGDFNI